jgi:putative Ca2+/H+ antiporter (TMEM165/GDT1 family)
MDLKVFFATFSAVFLAELGDKTQLAGLNLSARSGKPLTVFFGSVFAYAVITFVTVIIGDTVARFINRYCAATLFVFIGILMFTGKL